MTATNHTLFDEEQWLKLIFLLGDTSKWIDEQQRLLLQFAPVEGSKKLHRKTFYLTAAAFAHIIERHYHKIQRHPCTAKFIIPVIDILACLRDSSSLPIEIVKGSINLQRILDTNRIIGYDRSGQNTSVVTVITDPGGRIITAFPGRVVNPQISLP